jgi:hypothetical protein
MINIPGCSERTNFIDKISFNTYIDCYVCELEQNG